MSSTIPSLTALTRARQPSRSAAHVNWPDGRPPGAIRPAALPPKLLITVVPQTPGMEPLAGADEEAVAVEREAGGAPITTLRGRQATCDAVQAALAGHSFAHFACHGVLDLAEPSQSGVCLYDGVLSVTSGGPTACGKLRSLHQCGYSTLARQRAKSSPVSLTGPE